MELRSVEVLPAGADAWRWVPDLALPRTALGAAALDGRLYAVGGQVLGSSLSLNLKQEEKSHYISGKAWACSKFQRSLLPQQVRWHTHGQQASNFQTLVLSQPHFIFVTLTIGNFLATVSLCKDWPLCLIRLHWAS